MHTALLFSVLQFHELDRMSLAAWQPFQQCRPVYTGLSLHSDWKETANISQAWGDYSNTYQLLRIYFTAHSNTFIMSLKFYLLTWMFAHVALSHPQVSLPHGT